MIDRFLPTSQQIDTSRPYPARLRPIIALLFVSSTGMASLITISLLGPTSLASLRPIWFLTFLALLVATLLWWIGYLWLLRRLAGWDWRLGLQKSTVLLSILSLSLLPVMAVFLTGKLPYSLTFNPDTQSLYLWLTSAVLGAVVIGQELTLIHAANPGGLGKATAWSLGLIGQLPVCVGRFPRAVPGLVRNHPLLLIVLVIGVIQRLVEINAHHGGDMDVMLSVTFASLQWPPFGYYHAYRPQPWIYNHFPLFPFLLAPSYWLFENLFHWPTVWAAKIQSGLADMAIAILLYRCAQGRWRKHWGSALAAAWFLSPWVIAADDHAVGMAAAFAVASVAALQRGWLAGLLLALGVATRNEAAFFLFPLAFYFISQRRLGQTVAFFGAFGTTLALVVGPFILTDPEAIDYALRKHTEHIASAQISTLLGLLIPFLDPNLAALLRQKQEVLAIGFNLLIALLAIRDPRPERVLVVAAAGYILALPVVHQRYIVFLYSLGLLYAARFRDPLVAVLIVAATWPGIVYGPQAMNLLFIGLIVLGLLRLGKAYPVVSLKDSFTGGISGRA